MGDIHFMNRENKKNHLRSKIVPLPSQERPFSYDGQEERNKDWRSTKQKKNILFSIMFLIFVAVLIFAWYQYQQEYQYTDYDILWKQAMRYVDDGNEQADGTESTEGNMNPSVGENSVTQFVYFGENMLKYSRDGATYIDATGKNVWTQSYEMKNPIINTNGDYVIIADQQGNDIYICNTSGCQGVAKTQLPITKAAVSAQGVTAAVVEDSTASYVFYYRRDGAPLGINIKMLLSGDGYPLDLALSPDGQQIVMSVMYLKNGMIKNKVVFYDFSEIGKNVNNRFIGGFEEEFDDKMAARVCYLNKDMVCAFSDKGMTFISVKDVIPDPNVISVPVEEEIVSICYSSQYAAVVVNNPSGSPYRMDVYTLDGRCKTSFGVDYAYKGVEIDGDRILFYNDESCVVYDVNGNKKFEKVFDFPISCVRKGKRGNSLILAGYETMKEVRLK